MTVRLDKWLWAARFFKTRGLARGAIDGGHIDYNDTRAKPSKTVEVGAKLRIQKGQTTYVIQVLALSDQRRGAPEAQALYQETDDSRKARAEEALRRKALASGIMAPSTRPNKKDRRDISRLQRQETP